MIAAAFVIALAAAPPIEVWRVELPFVVSASSPSSNVETTVLPWIALRAGRSFSLAADGDDDGASFGFDGALLASAARAGTSEVATTRGLVAGEARALFSPGRVSSTFTALTPYGYAGVLVGGGAVVTQAFAQKETRPIVTWGAHTGLGASLAIHGVTTALELGLGVRDVRFELVSALLLGVSF